MLNIFDQLRFTGYENAYFNSDMELYQEYLVVSEDLKLKKLSGIVSQDTEIAPENQLVYNDVTTRLMDYNRYLNNFGTNIWERYAQVHPLKDPPVDNVPNRTSIETAAEELISGQPMVPGGQSATFTNDAAAQSNDEVNDITAQQIKMEQWYVRYNKLITEIANSSPERREKLIKEHQPELDKFQDSKINVKNDLEYLRNVQDHLNAKLAGRDFAFVKRFQYNIENISGPENTAFVDAECSDDDIMHGYILERNENNVMWRVNSAGIPHPDDLDKFFEQKRVIQLAFEKTVKESTLEPEIRAMTPEQSFQWEFSNKVPWIPVVNIANDLIKGASGKDLAGYYVSPGAQQEAKYATMFNFASFAMGALSAELKATQGLSKAGNVIEKVEIVDRRGSPLGEIDKIDLKNGLFIEDKSAKGLNIINPRTGMPQQTTHEWANKQIFTKTQDRIKALENNAVATRATKDGTTDIPGFAEIKDFKKFEFRIDADTPELRQAVNNSIDQLRIEYPEYTFEVIFGGGQ